MRRGGLGKGVEIVTALEHRDDASGGVIVRYASDDPCRLGVGLGGHLKLGKRVAAVRVETRRQQNELRAEGVGRLPKIDP